MNKRMMIVGSTLALALGVLSTTAHARSIGGASGRTAGGTATTCHQEFFGAIQSSCASPPPWIMSLAIDSGYYYSPSFNVVGPGGTISCFSRGTDLANTSHWTSPTVYNSVNGASTISPGTVYVPGAGYLHGACFLNSSGAQLVNVTW